MKKFIKALLFLCIVAVIMRTKAMNEQAKALEVQPRISSSQPQGNNEFNKNGESSSLEYLEKEVVGSHLIRNHIPGNPNLLSDAFKKYLARPSLNKIFKKFSSAIFSPDGSKIFIGSLNGSAKIWCPRTQKDLVTFQHDDPVGTAVFSPDGNLLFTGPPCRGYEQNGRIWDVATGKLMHVFEVAVSDINLVAFSPDGRKILTGCSLQGAKLSDVITGSLIHSFYHDRFVSTVMFSPDGSKILTGSEDYFARLWNTDTGNLIHTFEYAGEHQSAFNPDGTLVLISSGRCAKLWDVTTGNLIHSFKHDNNVYSVAFNFDGSQVLTGSKDGTTKLWNTTTGDCIHTLKKNAEIVELDGELEEESENYEVWEANFTHDGTKILSRFGEYGALLWDTSSGNLIHVFDPTEFVEWFAISPDDTQILIQSTSEAKWNTAELWDIPDHRALDQLLICLNLNQSDLLQAFELAIREKSRIHLKSDAAGNQIMETFRTLPLAIQRKLERFIVKEPNQNTQQSSSSSTTTGKRKYDENNR